jgi:hypothetical protein
MVQQRPLKALYWRKRNAATTYPTKQVNSWLMIGLYHQPDHGLTRKIAHCPFYTLTLPEIEIFVKRFDKKIRFFGAVTCLTCFDPQGDSF